MLSIGKLGAGGARYYTEGLGAVAEYYSEAGSRRGVWMGLGAVALGLEGGVDAEVLSHVLEGRDPAGGDRLSGTRSVVPAFDLCFRAPKSLSLLQALGDQEVAAQVLAAHREAVSGALGWLEREAVMVRRGHAEATVVPAGGVVGGGVRAFHFAGG